MLPAACVWQWWEGQRHYFLQRARDLHDAFTTHQEAPAAPVPDFLKYRQAADRTLPQVELVTRQQETQQAGASRRRKASSQAGVVPQEEEVHAMFAYVVTQCNRDIFVELMQCLLRTLG